MANIKSAKKRVLIERERNQTNNSKKSEIRTEIKKLKTAIAENNVTEAEKLLSSVSSLLDSAARENVIHANNAARKKAHYSKLVENLKK